MNLLEVKDLKVYYRTLLGLVKAVDGVSFDIKKREAFGLVGESGCGKTTLAFAMLKILPQNSEIIGGNVFFRGEDLLRKNEAEMRKIRWKAISIIFQSPVAALNPVHRVGDQVLEAILTHEAICREEALKKCKEIFGLVKLDPARIWDYPHEFSGGMAQRAIIAMALVCRPQLLIADEPVTALDLALKWGVLGEIGRLIRKLKMSMLYISHDLTTVAKVSNSIGVMYAGKLVERAPTTVLLKDPLHPYTKGLIRSIPRIDKAGRLESIPGEPPSLLDPPPGCRFHPRCKFASEICMKSEPGFAEFRKKHWVACHLWDKK